MQRAAKVAWPSLLELTLASGPLFAYAKGMGYFVEYKEIEMETGTWRAKAGLAQMLKGGVIMDVVTADQARIAEEAGAVAVMALERVPSDIRAQGGVARMSDPDLIEGIKNAADSASAGCRLYRRK